MRADLRLMEDWVRRQLTVLTLIVLGRFENRYLDRDQQDDVCYRAVG